MHLISVASRGVKAASLLLFCLSFFFFLSIVWLVLFVVRDYTMCNLYVCYVSLNPGQWNIEG